MFENCDRCAGTQCLNCEDCGEFECVCEYCGWCHKCEWYQDV